MVISAVPERTGTDILSSWQNPHIGALTCGVRTIMVGKAGWKALERSLPRNTVNQKQYWIPGDYRGYSHHQGLERCRCGDLTTPPFNSPMGPVQKTDET